MAALDRETSLALLDEQAQSNLNSLIGEIGLAVISDNVKK